MTFADKAAVMVRLAVLAVVPIIILNIAWEQLTDLPFWIDLPVMFFVGRYGSTLIVEPVVERLKADAQS